MVQFTSDKPISGELIEVWLTILNNYEFQILLMMLLNEVAYG
jgi:hypothetical protein